MSIEITLKNDDALAYIQNEKLIDAKYEQLLRDYQEIQHSLTVSVQLYDDMKAKCDALQLDTKPVSTKVVRDTELVEDITKSKPKFVQPIKVKPDNLKYGTWTEGEIALIDSIMEIPDTNTDRRLTVIAGRLNRPVNATRSKLTELGIKTVKGMCYKKD